MLLNFRFYEKCGKERLLRDCLILVLVFTFSGTVVNAQQSVNASGGNASGTGGNVSYSVGQIVYTTHTGINGSVAQGVQQPYEISVITAIEEAKDIDLVCTAYPNPTAGLLTLIVQNYKHGKLAYQLYDMSGKVIESKEITSSETAISLVGYAVATYFLKLTDNHKEIKTFKIIKNQ
ncbi:MAG TPA: T9SS type A sorting domain-containing protein [Bacteroidales bacterium]|nr:T9SS type A sorting domain-containing protein [Bacteroidales bacterium]